MFPLRQNEVPSQSVQDGDLFFGFPIFQTEGVYISFSGGITDKEKFCTIRTKRGTYDKSPEMTFSGTGYGG